MKNKLLILPILMLFTAFPLSAETSIVLQEFDGGSLSFNMGFNTDWMYGSRGDALRSGGAMSTLDVQPSFTSYNPAVLCFLPSATASLGLVPVSIISSDIFYGIIKSFAPDVITGNDFNGFLTGMVNDGLSSGLGSAVTIAAGVSTDISGIDASFGQTTGLMGFEIMVPFARGQAAFAFARENKTSIDMSMMLTGLEALISVSDPDQPLMDIDMRAKVNAVMNFRVDNIVTSFGVGRKLTPDWGIGCVAEHYDSRFLLDGRAEADGTATYSGTTMEFNTNEGNSLEQRAMANIVGEAWGLRFGTSYHFMNNTLELGADFSVQPQINFKGSPEVLLHTIPDSIDLSDFTKTTVKNVDIMEGSLKLKLPSFLRLTFAARGGAGFTLNYTRYFDSYSLKFNNGFDDMEYHFQMMDGVNLGVNFGVFQIGAGAIYSRIYQKTNGVQENIAWLALPMLSTGAVIPIGDYLKWEIDLFVFPLSVLKTAITYTFK